jgi:hypothetical protein
MECALCGKPDARYPTRAHDPTEWTCCTAHRDIIVRMFVPPRIAMEEREEVRRREPC